jgi:hypothetical protein
VILVGTVVAFLISLAAAFSAGYAVCSRRRFEDVLAQSAAHWERKLHHAHKENDELKRSLNNSAMAADHWRGRYRDEVAKRVNEESTKGAG